MRITETSPCDVVFTLPEAQVHLVVAALREARQAGREGPAAQAWDREGRTLLDTGVLLSLDNQIDTATGTVKLKARFPNRGETRLFPNQFVNARLLARTLRHAVTVPAGAVQMGARGFYVYVVRDGAGSQAAGGGRRGASDPNAGGGVRVALREVTPGVTTDALAVIEKGLEAGETVVVDGLDRLRDGADVRVAATSETPKAETF